jgi:hypothetical protein
LVRQFRRWFEGETEIASGVNPTVLLAPGEHLIMLVVDDGNGGSDADEVVVTVNLAGVLTELGPARIWVGLKKSDDVGIKFDFLVEVYRNAELIGSGQLDSAPGGSSGFNNARLNAVPLNLAAPAHYAPGDVLSIKVYVRNAAVGSGKNSGTARLWFDDAAADSRLEFTRDAPTTMYLRAAAALGTDPGPGPKLKIDVAAGAKGSPFKLFGTWSAALP